MTWDDEQIGKRIDRWQLDEVLGAGGSGAVYAALDLQGGPRVAVKILYPSLRAESAESDEARLNRFQQEADLAARLDGAGVVRIIHQSFAPHVGPYIVMELLQGQTLHERSRQEPRLRPEELLEIVDHVLDTLAAAEREGICHRDIKPSNIFLCDDGGIRLLDFGAAWVARREAITSPGLRIGTLEYLSPEQARGEEPDVRADIWALGAVLFTILTGTRVHASARTEAEIQLAAANRAAPKIRTLLRELPESVANLVDSALMFDKRDRFSSPRAMQAALRKAREHYAGRPAGAVPTAVDWIFGEDGDSFAVCPICAEILGNRGGAGRSSSSSGRARAGNGAPPLLQL